MSNLNNYVELKEKVEQAQQEADKAEGALGQIMKRLKDEFECSTLKQAVTKLKSLQKKQETLEGEFETAVKEFEEKWDNESN